MKRNPKNKLLIILVVTALITLGFYRDFLFYNIKSETMYQSGEHFDNFTDSSLKWLSNLNLKQIYWLRWWLTILFSTLFFIITLILIQLIFKTKEYNKRITYLFFGTIIFAALVFFISPTYSQDNMAYTTARNIIGYIQSPLFAITLIPIIWLDQTNKTRNT